MYNINKLFEDAISSAVNAGTSIEDIAELFTQTLNAETERIKKEKMNQKKNEDALQIMRMVGAFMTTHYNDDKWTDEVVEASAKEFVAAMDAIADLTPHVKDLFSWAKSACIPDLDDAQVPEEKEEKEHKCGCKKKPHKVKYKVASSADFAELLDNFEAFIQDL